MTEPLREPDPSLVTLLHVTYALHALGLAIGAFGASTIVGSFVFGWPSIIAVIINYVKRPEARGTWVESHVTWQIRTFWFAFLWSCLVGITGLLLAIVIVGFAIWAVGFFVLGVWAIYRITRGWLALQARRVIAVALFALLVLPRGGAAQVPLPTVTGPVTGPGAMYPGLREVPAGTSVEAMGYEATEYFVSGTAAGKPYTTRIVVRAPRAGRRASGIVVAEPMHGSGNSWMFFMTRIHLMNEGHVHVEIAAQKAPTDASIVRANPERYKPLAIPDAGQVNEIIAQVGAFLKSPAKPGPLGALTVRKLLLMGTSQSAGVLRAYLPLHATHRLAGGAPIYDGYFPTSTGGDQPIVKVDVPLIQMATQTEVNAALATGHRYRRDDGDQPGNQFRLFEMAGMPHNDARENPTYVPNDPCVNPTTSFPVGAMMSVGLEQLIRWVDKGTAPRRAPRVEISANQMVLDEYGNVKGGVRNTYVDVPTSRFIVPNKGKPELPPEVRADFYCNITGYEEPLPADRLKTLYRDKAGYQRKVEARLKELTSQGWFLPVYEKQVLSDAAAVALR